MTPPVLPLIASNLRAWFGAKGFVLVLAAALVPMGLTAAWVGTHDADVEAVSLTWGDDDVAEGDDVTFAAVVRNAGDEPVDGFNATVAVGTVFNGRFLTTASNTTRVEDLAPGEERTLTLAWTAQPGTYYALLDVDTPDATDVDEVAEIDEYNNQIPLPLVVGYRPGATPPPAPGNLTGAPDGAPVDLALAFGDVPDLAPRDNATFTLTVTNEGSSRVENATVTFRIARPFGDDFFSTKETSETVSLDPGASKDVRLLWTAQEGAYWLEGRANVTGNLTDGDASDNHRAESFTVDPVLGPDARPPDPPEKQTLKEFYLAVLLNLHWRVLIPLVGLFYAVGVVVDEREKGALPYLLTRPVPRWTIPTTKFLASFLVAAVAIVVGIVATYLMLFRTAPQASDVGFLTTPILLSLLALLAYGALFTLLGVVSERPYLVGLAFVVGWEFVAYTFVPWVENLTLYQHVMNAIVPVRVDGAVVPGSGWAFDQGLQWLPGHADNVRAVQLVLGLAVAFVALAAYAMKRREFEV